MNAMLILAVAAIPSFVQKVVTEWPSAEAAEAASAEIVELDTGEKYLWTCRWDDRNGNHRFLCKALSDVGMKYTAQVSGRSTKEFTPIMREIVAAGGSIGVHTIGHDYMNRMLPMKCFREILQNRVELEIDSQSPVVSFVAPYGHYACGRNRLVCGEAIANAGLLGSAEGVDNLVEWYGLQTNRWVAMRAFRANDGKPDKAAFERGFREGIARIDAGKASGGPVLTLGAHPWQDEAGRKALAAMVKEAFETTPGLVALNQNEYIARRLQFLNSQVKKVGARGRQAVFAVRRPRVCELGAKMPVLLKLSDGRIVKVDAPAAEDVPKEYVEVPGALSASDDRSKFAYDYENKTGRRLKSVEFVLRLPPGYEPGVVRKTLSNVAPGHRETVRCSARPSEDPVARQGTFYAAMEVNFAGSRLWTQLEVPQPVVRVACPRDEAVACGPFLKKDAPPEASMRAMSAPQAPLDGVGDCKWFRCDGSREGDAVWAVTAYRKGERNRMHKLTGWTLPPEDKRTAYMLCHSFEVDLAAHGDKWDVEFSGGHVTEKNTKLFLNGEPLSVPFKALKGLKLRNGENRLLVYFFDVDCNMLYTTFEARSAKDGAVAKALPLQP